MVRNSAGHDPHRWFASGPRPQRRTRSGTAHCKKAASVTYDILSGKCEGWATMNLTPAPKNAATLRSAGSASHNPAQRFALGPGSDRLSLPIRVCSTI